MLWNISSIRYYIVSGEQNATYIANASYNWRYPFGPGSNPLGPNTRTYDKNISAIDYYEYWDANSGVNAYTNFILNPDKIQVNPDISNWSFGRIYLNNEEFTTPSNSMTPAQYAQGVVAHEQGHVFGLDHRNDFKNSIMCQDGFGRAVYTVQRIDNDLFNLIH